MAVAQAIFLLHRSNWRDFEEILEPEQLSPKKCPANRSQQGNRSRGIGGARVRYVAAIGPLSVVAQPVQRSGEEKPIGLDS